MKLENDNGKIKKKEDKGDENLSIFRKFYHCKTFIHRMN